jgi:N-methylhydantoinase A
MPAHFSAFGMLLADARYDASQTWSAELPESGDTVEGLAPALEKVRQELARKVSGSLGGQGALRFEDYAEMRYRGQDQTVKVRLSEDLSPRALKHAFNKTYLERYGHVSPMRIQIVSLRVSCQASLGAKPGIAPAGEAGRARPSTERSVYSPRAGGFVTYAIHDREGLAPGVGVSGPCFVDDHATTTNVPQGWSARVLEGGVLELTRNGERDGTT